MKDLLQRLEDACLADGAEADDTVLSEPIMPVGERLTSSDKVETVWPPLPNGFRHQLIEETVYAVLAIGGHENPPARHIVGLEGTASVKEKLRTVSEELEDFVETSCAVDL
jgi:hypothetical protein